MCRTCNAAVRMKKRMIDNGFKNPIDIITYKRGTHLTLPEVIPGQTFLSMMHSEGRKHRKQCKKVRIDIKNKLKKILSKWQEKKMKKKEHLPIFGIGPFLVAGI